MFKNLKLSVKIASGFAAILTIAIILGMLAVWSMSSVSTTATKLDKEYAPSVKVANEVERNSLQTMYNIRGYSLTENSKYLDLGKKYLGEVKQFISDAKTLAGNYQDLGKLKENTQNVEIKVNEYEKLLNETISAVEAMNKDRTNLDASAKKYMDGCYAFLNSQSNSMRNEIMGNASKDTLNERYKKTVLINDLIDTGNNIRLAVQKGQAILDLKIIQDSMGKFDEITNKLTELSPIVRVPANIAQLDQIKVGANEYKAAAQSLLKNWATVDEIKVKREEVANAVLVDVEDIANTGIKDTMDASKSASTSLTTANVVMIIGLLIAIALGIVLGFIIIISITKPINRVVAGLSEGSEQVTAASEQLSTASQRLAEANSEQASSIQETSSTLEESSSMVQQNSENTKQAAALAQRTKDSADKGNNEMAEMMEAIGEIKKSSDQISKIIKVIDEIAFQTNILALNAAVEAARAGDAGMGFAVVAEEVRNLAQRSAQAAKDTASIIEKNIELSGRGVEVAKKVGESLSDITLQAKKVNELMDEIAVASQEQAQGITQINKAIVQMEKATQENASTAEESASASEQLSAQAETLKEIVLDLVRLVSGSDTGSALNHTKQSNRSNKMFENANMIIKKATRNRYSGTSTHSSEARKSTHKFSAEDVIPLERDKDDF